MHLEIYGQHSSSEIGCRSHRKISPQPPAEICHHRHPTGYNKAYNQEQKIHLQIFGHSLRRTLDTNLHDDCRTFKQRDRMQISQKNSAQPPAEIYLHRQPTVSNEAYNQEEQMHLQIFGHSLRRTLDTNLHDNYKTFKQRVRMQISQKNLSIASGENMSSQTTINKQQGI